MNAIKDLLGQRFGSRVVYAAAPSRGGKVRWKVRCDCGRVDEVFGNELREGKALMCRPCALDERRAALVQSIAGQVFGLRTVIGASQRKRRSHRRIYVQVRCACGFVSDVSLAVLRRGVSQSCIACSNSINRQKRRASKFKAETCSD
ncbi:hypothetical protein AD952_11125 [Acetobacter cerevisiae]|uniref:Uncharacterized protein n=1 Tax=Acetobacter cerevisiae TaxID=178900 RepID=A0A149USK1_9PROT|nr:hypothetical protein AD952_11125 [Acetobacter cerevisiae]